MRGIKPLTERVERFCREYVARGGNGAEAARAVGYSDAKGGARIQASRLLQDPRVQLRVAQLRALEGNGGLAFLNRPSAGGAGGSIPPMDGEIYGPGDNGPGPRPIPPGETEEQKEARAGRNLTRNYVIANLMTNVEIAMGRELVETSVAVKRTIASRAGEGITGPKGGGPELAGYVTTVETVSATKVRISDRNGAVANQALSLLSQQLEAIKSEGGELTEENKDRTKTFLDRTHAKKYAGLRAKMRASV